MLSAYTTYISIYLDITFALFFRYIKFNYLRSLTGIITKIPTI